MNLIVPALAERSAMFASPSAPAASDRASAILHAARRLLPATLIGPCPPPHTRTFRALWLCDVSRDGAIVTA
jgi:hypothetical protein